ncbi:pirin family protein [uncultured Maribacter sp.]|uniref:pirin family protein n=1 Tax=uncultured Maribacter sp. TaxID=431308 RepID=UPI00262E4CD7|nr:pirin family protein [uncultured Maribacter sp.]
MSSSIKSVFPLGFPWQTQDPFLFCAYHYDLYPKGNEEMGPAESLEGRNLGNDFTIKDGWRMYHGKTIPGFPSHPHRGFETVTLANKGFCDHSDSLGAAGRFGNGDVQWMTAGAGVQHSEMFPLLNAEKENPLELFQIWLNLEKDNKFVPPHFAMLWNEDIPVVTNHNATIKIIAGKYNGISACKPAPNSWAANPENEVAIWTLTINANTEFLIPASKNNISRTLYFYEGDSIMIEENTITANYGIDLVSNSETILKTGTKKAHVLLLQGKPIKEPIVKHGPFVMNTEEEIKQAMKEYGLTQFGGWPWQYTDNVHPKEKGRFAKYPDGTLVEK